MAERRTEYWGTGRRKTAVARVRLFAGEGAVHLYPAWDVPLLDGLSPSVETLIGQIEGVRRRLFVFI